jgi:hypothetical protein
MEEAAHLTVEFMRRLVGVANRTREATLVGEKWFWLYAATLAARGLSQIFTDW